MSWRVRDLTVRFGSRIALSHIDLTLDPGVVHAVVGGDGAGKTTLLRVLAGLRLDATGEVRLPAPGKIGYVPPAGGVFGDLTVRENMEFIADAFGLHSWRDRAAELLEGVGLDRFPDRLADRLSGGQRRKLAGSMVLLPRPDLLVLDEVTTGVDPVSRMDLWRLIAGAAAGGAAVVLATSYLDEAERAGHVILLHRGRMLVSGVPHEIISAIPGSVEDVAHPSDATRAWRHGSRWRQWNPAGRAVSNGAVRLEDAAIVAELAADGIGV
jgi:ABC-2 type transport system ATP-binding protein